MTIELISSRIVAPLIGSSIFTWTSIIGIILLGLSIGNLLGGRIADRYVKIYKKRVLSISFLISAFFVYLIIPLSKNLDFIIDPSYSIITHSILVCIFLYLFPSIAIGTISPIIFNLYVNNIENIGKKYGLLSGLWSFGSILGVFITGFYFISKIGSSGSIYFISFVFILLFYFFYINSMSKSSIYLKYHVLFLIIIFIIFFILLYSKKENSLSKNVIYQKETPYYQAKVVNYDIFPQFGKNKLLFLDIDSHSIHTENRSKYFYTDIYPIFPAFSKKIDRIHIIGAGAYTLPIHFREQYPNSQISVSEIDPEIEIIGKNYFDLDKYNIKTEVGDARMKFTKNNTINDKYDLIYGDAYNSFISVPWHLLTTEFVDSIKDNLNNNGIYAINFIGSLEGKNSKIFESIYKTINISFPNNYIFAFGTDPKMIQSITIIAVKNSKYIDYETLKKDLGIIDPSLFLSRILFNKKNLDEKNDIENAQILTDNFSPIEYMMENIMKEYYSKYFKIYRKIMI